MEPVEFALKIHPILELEEFERLGRFSSLSPVMSFSLLHPLMPKLRLKPALSLN